MSTVVGYFMTKNSCFIVETPGYKPIAKKILDQEKFQKYSIQSISDSALIPVLAKNSSEIKCLIVNALHKNFVESYQTAFDAAKSKPYVILISDTSISDLASELSAYIDIFPLGLLAYQENEMYFCQELDAVLAQIFRDQQASDFPKTLMQNARFTVQKNLHSTQEKELFIKELEQIFESYKLGGHLSKIIQSVFEELASNAFYDAPKESGLPEFSAMERSKAITLPEKYAPTVEIRFDQDKLILSVKDTFGALTRARFFKYIHKLQFRSEEEIKNLVDEKKLGAGLGFYKILYFCHSLFVLVEPKVQTQVVAVISLKKSMRDFAKSFRSICYL